MRNARTSKDRAKRSLYCNTIYYKEGSLVRLLLCKVLQSYGFDIFMCLTFQENIFSSLRFAMNCARIWTIMSRLYGPSYKSLGFNLVEFGSYQRVQYTGDVANRLDFNS